jgi:hypothetical protein
MHGEVAMSGHYKIGCKYLPLDVVGFQFRHDDRENVDVFAKAVHGC